MQTLDEALQEVTARVEQVKERVKDGAREVERLRMQRAELEKQVKAGKDEVEDGRVAGLYDWCVACQLWWSQSLIVNDPTGSQRRSR